MARASTLISNLVYDDPEAAARWLCRAFGFEEVMIAKDEGGRFLHGELRFGQDLLFVAPPYEKDGYKQKAPADVSTQSQSVCGATEDVDAHYARALAAGAKILTELADTHWGARMYTCADPEGHIWTFGNYWGAATTE